MPINTNTYYPYKLARLVHYDYDVSKDWYIDFSAYEVTTGKLTRKRIFEINKIKDVKKRRVFAENFVKDINKKLTNGFHFNAKKLKQNKILEATNNEAMFMSVENAYMYALEIIKNQLNGSSIFTYKSAIKSFLDYLKEYNLIHEDIRHLTNKSAIMYVDKLLNDDNKSGATINKLVGVLKSTTEKLIEREIITINIFKGIKKQKEVTTKQNLAYTLKEVEIIKEYLIKKDLLVWEFCQFIFYSFMRPNEIRQLRKKDVNLKENYIKVSAEISKTKIERHVHINKSFKILLQKLIANCDNDNSLLFTLNKNDNNKPIGKNTLSSRYRIYLKELGLGTEYTLYAWKHTGNVIAYKNKIDIYSLMQQNGHTEITTTMKYLKSLGLMIDKELTQKFDSIKI